MEQCENRAQLQMPGCLVVSLENVPRCFKRYKATRDACDVDAHGPLGPLHTSGEPPGAGLLLGARGSTGEVWAAAARRGLLRRYAGAQAANPQASWLWAGLGHRFWQKWLNYVIPQWVS